MKYYLLLIFSIFCLWLFSNCSTELTDFENSSDNTSKLVLDVSCRGYSDEPDTRATGTKWEEGDKVYIRFNSTAYGVGTYSNGDWGEITIKGSKLSPISGAQCSVYYFKGDAVSETGEGVALGPLTCIYGSKNALFSYSDKTVTVSAYLAPMMSRLRFKGTKNEKINLSSNFLHYSSYSFASDEFITETSNTILTVNEDGYSDYIYVLAPEEIQLSLTHNRTNYSKSFSQSLFIPGFSGVIQIPTEQNPPGWEKMEGRHNGHEYVDLGLPSGTLWATCNIGATTPEGYGDYFAWGETTVKTYYDWSTYKYCNGTYNTLTKYNNNTRYGIVDNKTVLDPEDDAAHVNWGGSWRMPTKEEQDELISTNNCTWTWTTQNGTKGYNVTSNRNNNSLFLPVAGRRHYSNLYNAGNYGFYWSSSVYTSTPYASYYLFLYSGNVDQRNDGRYYGQSVRPVCAISE